MSGVSPEERRSRTLETLSSRAFDLLVIGGGIVGSRVAYDAARLGLSVALVDRGDFGCATSSASSKLVHGGLRYLAAGHVGLVRAARLEQHALRTLVAPHLVHEVSLVLAIDRDAPLGPSATATGLLLYDALSGFRARSGRRLETEAARALVPFLELDRVAGCALTREAQTDDGRLTLATVKAAERAGAVVCNYAGVVDLERRRGRVANAVVSSAAGEGTFAIRSRAVVNATGPWVDRIRALEDPSVPPCARFSKGVHAVYALPPGLQTGLALALTGNRAAFAVPWRGLLLVGVTDTPFEGDPGAARVTDDDLDALVASFAPFMSPALLARDRVLASFAGLRVLPGGKGDTAAARRSHVLAVGRGGMVSIAGGKLTTHRRLSLEALRALPDDVRPRRPALCDDGLPGSAGIAPASLPRHAGEEVASHLHGLFGDEAEMLARYRDRPDAFARIHPGAPDVWAQVDYAVDGEWAVTPTDVVRRRTTLALRGLGDEQLSARVGARMALARRSG